ncbi:hypothetical protein KC644_02155 [Candidatus Berkelbacteria bacterium]|nr:hypothetical protein [Candidatus Berkelbacteria bacterium]
MQRQVFIGILVGLILVGGIITWLNFNPSTEASPRTNTQISAFTRNGTITSFDNDLLKVSTDLGELSFTLESNPEIISDSATITQDDLLIGDNIDISYTDSNGAFTVSRIEKLPNQTDSASIPPGEFTLTIIPLCNGGQTENLLSWTAAENAFNYSIVIDGQVITQVNSQSYTHRTNLVVGQVYSYQVIAQNSQGESRSKEIPITIESCQ